MSTFSSAVMALAGPVAKKVLASLGVGFITYVGVEAPVNAALAAAKSNFGGLTADVVQIAALSASGRPLASALADSRPAFR